MPRLCQSQGISPHLRPILELDGRQTFWDLMGSINRTLKRHGFGKEAEEFRVLAEDCENDIGMLITVALAYVRVPTIDVEDL